MSYQAILFDLDGTLLPMDNDAFTRGYFGLLAKTVGPLGYTVETLVPALWQGVAAMVKNDGTRPNKAAFLEAFAAACGAQIYEHIAAFDRFYANEFHGARVLTQPTPMAAKAVALAREKADHVVLATNPLFPRVAIEARMSWAGVDPSSFAWITDYENSTTCKPNPAYYREICDKLALDPTRCLMIGNNVREDVEAAASCGMDTFLITDCLIGDRTDQPACPHGTFADLLTFLETV